MTNKKCICKNCSSSATVKFGKYQDTQIYWCKACQRKFKADDKLFNMRTPANYISSSLNMYYTGMSIGDISKLLKQEYDYQPSKHTVYNWINKYTDWAVNYFKDETPKIGDIWIADETAMDIDGRKVWFWDIIDTDTRYLLASRVSEVRTSHDAEMLMQTAYKRARKPPKQVLTDKLKAYLDGIELTFGGDTEHIQSGPFTSIDSTSMIERFHNTIKDRTKVMRGFRDMETLMKFMDGFLIFYNHFRPNEALGNKTPAEIANLDTNVNSWADICRLPVSKSQFLNDRAKPNIQRKRYKLPSKPPRKPKKTSYLIQAGIEIVRINPPKIGTKIPLEIRRQIGMTRRGF
nr:hypothetical protein DMOBY_01370 [Dehalococcoides mccartyi]